MGLIASVSGDKGKDFEQPKEMIQPGVLADIVDKGMIDVTYAGVTKKQHKCYFVWLLAEEDSEGRNMRVFQSFTVSLHEKAGLRKFLGTLGFKDFDGSFDLDTILGTQRMLVLSEEDGRDGGKYIRITGTTQLKKGTPCPTVPTDFVRKQDQPKG